jgi:hypothetical protein
MPEKDQAGHEDDEANQALMADLEQIIEGAAQTESLQNPSDPRLAAEREAAWRGAAAEGARGTIDGMGQETWHSGVGLEDKLPSPGVDVPHAPERENRHESGWSRNETVDIAIHTDPYESSDGQDRSPAGRLAAAERRYAHTVDTNDQLEEAQRAINYTRGVTERIAQANGLAYDMIHDPALAKQVFMHRETEGYDPTVVNMASQGYAYLKKADRLRKRGKDGDAEDVFKTGQRLMVYGGGIGVMEGSDRHPPATNVREAIWKAAGSARRAVTGRRLPKIH